MHIIISCFVRRKEKKREREKGLFCSEQIKSMPSLLLSLGVFFLPRSRTEQRKKNSINRGHIRIDRFESLPDTFAKGQVEREEKERRTNR